MCRRFPFRELNAPRGYAREMETDRTQPGMSGPHPTIAQLLAEERSILSTNRETLRSQLDGFEKSRALYEREIQAITGQIEAGKREAESVRKEFAEINMLRQKGLSSWSRELTLERTAGNQLKASAILGINRNTLHKKLAEFRIEDNGDGAPAAPQADEEHE